MKLVIDIPENTYKQIQALARNNYFEHDICGNSMRRIANGTPLPEGHGRLGDLDELEQRISNFVEHDSMITDEYTVARQRFIVEGIRETPTIIEADKEANDG